MAQFTFTWNNTLMLANINVTHARCSYMERGSVGGWITTGFTPSNNMLKTVTTATTPNTLLFNTVYQFKTDAICGIGGPIINTNNVQEAIKFNCIAPIISNIQETTYTATVSGLPTHITGVIFSVFQGLTQIGSNINITPASGIAVLNGTSLIPSTNYTIRVQFTAIVNGTLTTSTFTNCQTSFTTSAPSNCSAPTNLVVTVV